MLISRSSNAEVGLLKQLAKSRHPADLMDPLQRRLKHFTVLFTDNAFPRELAPASSIAVASSKSFSNEQDGFCNKADKRVGSGHFFSTKIYKDHINMFLSKLGYSELVQGLFEKMTFFLVDPLARCPLRRFSGGGSLLPPPVDHRGPVDGDGSNSGDKK